MLLSLSIRDLVLIERLELEFGEGLTVLTGETGAGKSILLNALALALGGRADRSLVRQGCARAGVSARFLPPPDHPARDMLAELGQEDEEIVLRRQIAADGRSRAWLNDEPVSGGLLRRLGDLLVEVHGQHDTRGLLDPSTHTLLLDRFGAHEPHLRRLAEAFFAWREAAERHAALRDQLSTMARTVEELHQRLEELSALAPEEGEEETLLERRTRLLHREKLAEIFAGAERDLQAGNERLAAALRRLERSRDLAGQEVAPIAEMLDRAVIEAAEAEAALTALMRQLDRDPETLESVESRLVALREAARKFRCPVDHLPALLQETRERLAALEDRDDELVDLERGERQAREAFEAQADALSKARQQAAEELVRRVRAELPPLRLERARFRIRLDRREPQAWNARGAERARFEVATNPGAPFGPLERIASGGELSRFMLALEVVMGDADSVPTMIFDEIDAGIGGAVADAVGERLARLARRHQVIVVTHAPQIAARAEHHLRVSKSAEEDRMAVRVEELDAAQRLEEVARMLAGAEVTEAARAAADSLLRHAAGVVG